jgi:hypothetical protein
MRLIPQYWEAVQGDDLRALRILLEQHPDLVHQRIKGESWAPGRIHDPDAKGQVPAPQDYPFTNTAVHFAAVNSKVELMKLLIEFGADLNAVGYEANKGLTPPIVLAAWEGSLETMRLLLEAGADPNLPASAENALYCAAEHKAPAKAALLEAFGARHDVFTAALTGRTWFVERELRAYEPLAERRSLKRHRTPDEEATYGQKERP